MSTCYNLCWLKLVDLAKYKYLIGQTRRLFLKLALFFKKITTIPFFCNTIDSCRLFLHRVSSHHYLYHQGIHRQEAENRSEKSK